MVTGSSGQLGAAISSMLAENHMVRGIDLVPGEFTTDVGNIVDRDFVFSVAEKIEYIIHTGSLHAPHLATHSEQEFIDTNIRGTLNLLEASVEKGIRRFVYSSTTSLYGQAMVSSESAVWVTEDLLPKPRDIYDVSKIAAEGLCEMFSQKHGLPCISLRVSRFFPETEYLTTIYRLYRGVDVRDAAHAHILGMTAVTEGYGVFNISALSPFSRDETCDLLHDAPSVLLRHFPDLGGLFAKKGWDLPKSIDRIYSIERAKNILGYCPIFNFDTLIKTENDKK